MSSKIVRSLRVIQRHKYKVITFGILPGIVYKTFMNSKVKTNSEDMGQVIGTDSKYK